jgi:hypothetical protein
MTILLRQFEQAKLSMKKISKLHGMLKIEHQNPINAIEQKMNAISKYHNSKIIHE